MACASKYMRPGSKLCLMLTQAGQEPQAKRRAAAQAQTVHTAPAPSARPG